MTLHTPLTVVERHRHSYDVFPDSNRTQPFGSGATCSYNYLDLQIKNETDTPFQLYLKVTDSHLIGEWRGASPSLYNYDVYEKAHQITPLISEVISAITKFTEKSITGEEYYWKKSILQKTMH